MTCAKCEAPRPAANLTVLPNGERWCPECCYAKADHDAKRQELHRPAPTPATSAWILAALGVVAEAQPPAPARNRSGKRAREAAVA